MRMVFKAIVAASLVGLSILMLSANFVRAEAIGGFIVPGSKAASAESCVEPTEFMRRYHMELIRHQRDATVYGGIRGTKHSLSGCVSCHASYDQQHHPVAVNAAGQFCHACHDYAAVTLNCFDCHKTTPIDEAPTHALPQHSVATGLDVQENEVKP
jgi:hypothetical protein